MSTLSKQSLDRLATCDERLQRLVAAVAADRWVVVVCGHRGEAEQNAAYKAGNSKLIFPKSKHNTAPSKAVDLAPSAPINWQDIQAFKDLGRQVKKKAVELNIKIRWGGDFLNFKDYPHFELVD